MRSVLKHNGPVTALDHQPAHVIYTAMMLIHQTAQQLLDEETDPDQARTDIVYYCIDGTIQHLIN